MNKAIIIIIALLSLLYATPTYPENYISKKPAPSRGVFLLPFEATAYCVGTITATGTIAAEGRTLAVDKDVIPLGSRVRLICPTYPAVNGEYVAEDTGAFRGKVVDIRMSDYRRCVEFGRREVLLEVMRNGSQP